jgi:hypothetical protein
MQQMKEIRLKHTDSNDHRFNSRLRFDQIEDRTQRTV